MSLQMKTIISNNLNNNIMKRIFIALALLAGFQFADAQVKSPADAKKAVEAAEAAAQNPKKAEKVATWLKLASTYMDAYNAPAGSAWVGASQQELKLIMGNEKPVSVQNAVLNGEPCTKEVYSNKELYFNGNGQLILINVTEPVFPDALARAKEAYQKASSVDVKASKVKDISAGLDNISKKYYEEGMNSYILGDLKKASQLFESAAAAAETAPLSRIDSTSIYNAGFTAWAVQDYERAQVFFEKCLSVNYYYEGGEVFAKLADVYAKLQKKAESKKVLEDGFTKYPESQSILIGLINYYLENNEDPEKLFELIDHAKKNEPNNASLYYVEGNIYKQLGKREEALKAYYSCSEINPDYEFGYIGAGILYYELALEYQDKAQNEFDDKKYMELVSEFEKALENAYEPFEKAFNVSKDDSIKINIAEYLKNICYRFREKDQKYEAGFEKYSTIVKEGRIN